MEQTQTNDLLERERLGTLMAKYAIPCVISLLVAALYNIVDQIFIANASYLGSYGNAANTVVFPLTVVALSLATMIGDGCCTFVSISLGAKEKESAHRGIGTSVVCVVAVGVVLMAIFLIFQDVILTAFGAQVNEETFQLSKEYFFWITLGIPFYMFGQAMNPIIRSDGSPRFAMVTLLIGAILNVIFDPICIFVLHWGMMGAAVATIFGQIVSALLSVFYLFRMKSVRLSRDSFKPRVALLKKILPLGITSFLSQISVVLSMAAVLNMVTKYGAQDEIFGQAAYSQIPTAVVGIVMKFYQIIISISVGLAAGCIPIAGYNIGARKQDRVLTLMKLLLITEAIVGLIATLVFLLFPYQFIELFGAKNESIYYTQFAVRCIRIFLCTLTLSCVNKGTFIFLQSLGKAKESSALSLMREVVFGVGLPILLPIFWGLDGILYFMPVADVLTFFASAAVIGYITKALRQPAAEETVSEYDSAAAQRQEGARTRTIITISRSYGAGGRTVGRILAERLRIPYYDAALLEETAKRKGLNQKFLESIDEKPIKSHMLYQYTGFLSQQYTSIEGLANRAQSEIIEQVAAEGPCVIVGRRADQILRDRPDTFHVFITASVEERTKRVAARDRLSDQESLRKLTRVDKERAAYYNQHSDRKWGDASSYDLSIDTDRLGLAGAAALIIDAVHALEQSGGDASAQSAE